jgi:Raf kinase inhibitor-like YbhB/YbcL family protein
MRRTRFIVLTILGSLAGPWPASALTLTSPDIRPGAKISMSRSSIGFGCSGLNISPALYWSGAPRETRSFAVSVYDPDAPIRSGYWHWVVFNIPSNVTSLRKGAGDLKRDVAPQGAVQSRTDSGAFGYAGPCPPRGDKPHRYLFTIFAVDVDKLEADENSSPAFVTFNLHFHTLAEAALMGVRGR